MLATVGRRLLSVENPESVMTQIFRPEAATGPLPIGSLHRVTAATGPLPIERALKIKILNVQNTVYQHQYFHTNS